MRAGDLVKVSLVALAIGLLLSLLEAHQARSRMPEALSHGGLASIAYDVCSSLRAFLVIATTMFVQEYLAYELRSGYTSILLRAGIGLRRYIAERFTLFTVSAVLMSAPTYFVMPVAIYGSTIFSTVLGDLATAIALGSLLSFVYPHIVIVVFGGMLTTIALRVYLPAALYTASKNLLVLQIMNPIHVWFAAYNETPSASLSQPWLVALSALYSAALLVITYVVLMRVAPRRIWRWIS